MALQRGFTLVELLIVVAIVGLLATLGTQGFRRHFQQSKSAEALQTVGAIGRAVHAAADRDRTSSEVLDTGNSSTTDGSKVVGSVSGKGKGQGQGKGATVTFGVPGLCGDADPVPSEFGKVTARKYQPNSSTDTDYNTGDQYSGWRCLRFTVDSPQSYQYRYETGGPPVDVALPHGGTPPGLDQDHEWTAIAKGDVDGDGVTSWFVLQGIITDTGQIIMAPAVGTLDSDE